MFLDLVYFFFNVTLSDRRDRGRGRRTRADRAFRTIAGRVIRQGRVYRGRLLFDDMGRVPVTEYHRANHTADVLVRPDAQQNPLRSSSSLRTQIYRWNGNKIVERKREEYIFHCKSVYFENSGMSIIE